MKAQKSKTPSTSVGFGAVFFLALVLGVLFWRSFMPEYVHFSNDGPLGQQNCASDRLPQGFLAAWGDNNDIGNSGGAWPLGLADLFRWVVGPIGYAKFLVPFALFILALGAWTFFRQLKLTPVAATFGAIAAMLNSTFFATSCWGVASQEVAIGMDFFAMALVVSISEETPLLVGLARLALAGLCVGMNVIEAADIGAIFSLFVSAFILFYAWNRETGQAIGRLGRGVGQIAIVAVFAGYIASQTVVSLVQTEITGVAGTSQDTESKSQHWDWATQWSLPKLETLGLFVPGLFGYKMDTPNGMDPNFAADYSGGNYWGAMGRDAAWDRYFAAGGKGPAPGGFMRQTGGENYAGVLVVLIALWAMTQALRKSGSPFSDSQRRAIGFWSVIAIVTILFAWGRFSIFYGLLYKLPYFSTIRNPTKFCIVFSWAIVPLFAYGVDGLIRRYLANTLVIPGSKPVPFQVQLKTWWATAEGFDRKWTFGCLAMLVVSLLGWLIFAGEKPAFISYLATVGLADSDTTGPLGTMIATFAIHQAGWFVLLFAIAAGLTILIISGVLGGRRGKLAVILLGLFLVVDMGRADLPYIIHWDYKQKYDIDPHDLTKSTNPILNILRDKYYEHRVAQLPFNSPPELPPFGQLYQIEWMQHQFPYYNIQSLDLFQRSRVSSDINTYENAIYFLYSADTINRLPREWQLTNVRYLLGPAGFLDVLNTQVDPVHHSFQIVARFNMVPKPGITNPTQLAELTAALDDNGNFALFQYNDALPRAKLYSNWLVTTNDDAVLKSLGNPAFDPVEKVLVDTPQPGLAPVATNANTGTVEYKSYEPTKIVLAANSSTPGVLLLNDKYDPDWKITVDGQPAPLLRCNYIMRGVSLTPGAHTVEFQFTQPEKPLFITLSAFGVAILLIGFLVVSGRTKPEDQD